MKITNRFVSTVVIGRFNPSILTPEFLKSECDIDLGEAKYTVPEDVPIERSIEYEEKGVSFLASLDRFQVMESKFAQLNAIIGPQLTMKYLDRLQYTPIHACGINFNFGVELKKEEEKGISNFLNNEEKFFEVFEIDGYEIETKKYRSKDGTVSNYLWTLTFLIKNGLKSSLGIRLMEPIIEPNRLYELNHNLEVTDLKQNRENIKLITENVEQNIGYHQNIMDKFLKELSYAPNI